MSYQTKKFKCKKCGSLYYNDCIPWAYRNGGAIPETDGRDPLDLVALMSKARHNGIDGLRLAWGDLRLY